MDTLAALNLAVICVYAASFITAALNIRKIRSTFLYGTYRYMICVFNISLLIQSAVFIYFQIQWVLGDHNSDIGAIDAIGWAVYDYFNGFALLSYAVLMNTYLGWKVIDQGQVKHKVEQDLN